MNATHGKLINFRPRSVESRFVNTTFTADERHLFKVDITEYSGHSELPTLVRGLVADWGTGLNASLYRRALLHCHCSGNETDHLLPMKTGGEQRFHLLDEHSALGVTTFSKVEPENVVEFKKLLMASPLSQLHWLNITHSHVNLITIRSDRNI